MHCKLTLFDDFFVREYDYLLGFSKSINPRSDYESLLHDVYIKCKDRIMIAGYSGSSFLNFTRVSLMNQYKSNYRLEQKRPQIDYSDPNYNYHIEATLQSIQEAEEEQEEYMAKVIYLNTMIFQYIDEYYDNRSQFIFKTYFLLKPKKLNYKKLSEVTGYSITSVSNTIKNMKIDIKENLENYINGNTIGRSKIFARN